MRTDCEQTVLQKELEKVIKKMKRIQKNISADDQPVAMHQVDALAELGKRYAEVVSQLKTHEN